MFPSLFSSSLWMFFTLGHSPSFVVSYACCCVGLITFGASVVHLHYKILFGLIDKHAYLQSFWILHSSICSEIFRFYGTILFSMTLSQAVLLSRDNLFSISHQVCFVNTFLKVFCFFFFCVALLSTAWLFYIYSFPLSRAFFIFLFLFLFVCVLPFFGFSFSSLILWFFIII